MSRRLQKTFWYFFFCLRVFFHIWLDIVCTDESFLRTLTICSFDILLILLILLLFQLSHSLDRRLWKCNLFMSGRATLILFKLSVHRISTFSSLFVHLFLFPLLAWSRLVFLLFVRATERHLILINFFPHRTAVWSFRSSVVILFLLRRFFRRTLFGWRLQRRRFLEFFCIFNFDLPGKIASLIL